MTKLTIPERLWVYNIAWIGPLLLAAAMFLGRHVAWTGPHSHKMLTFLLGGTDILLWIASFGYPAFACIARFDSTLKPAGWNERRAMAVSTRGLRRLRKLHRRGYLARPRPGGTVEIVTPDILESRGVPHFWPLSLGYKIDRYHSSREFDDSDEDAIIAHINTLRATSGDAAIDSRTVALTRALNR